MMDNENVISTSSQIENTPISQLDHQLNNHSPLKWILLIILVAIFSSAGTYLAIKSQSQTANQIRNNSQITQAPVIPPTITTLPSPDTTNNWKTFIDAKNRFTFKYPSDYIVSTDVGLLNDSTKSWIFGVDVSNSYSTAQDLINKLCPKDSNGTTFCSINPSTEILDGVQYTNNTSHYTAIGVVLNHNNLIYEIHFNARNPNQSIDSNVKNIFSQILSTFKFTDQTQSSLLAPADSQLPTAGICSGVVNGIVALVTINVDTATPRCIKILPTQKIQVKNNTDKSLQISLGGVDSNINSGDSYTFEKTAGTFLAPGVHILKSSPYQGGEVWVQNP